MSVPRVSLDRKPTFLLEKATKLCFCFEERLTGVMLHPYPQVLYYTPIPITATSLQQSLNSIPMTAILESFGCDPCSLMKYAVALVRNEMEQSFPLTAACKCCQMVHIHLVSFCVLEICTVHWRKILASFPTCKWKVLLVTSRSQQTNKQTESWLLSCRF